MPSWKKVITSGSDAVLRSVTATAGFTGSVQGTASWASNVTNASNASNLITSLTSVPGVVSSGVYFPTLAASSNSGAKAIYQIASFAYSSSINTLLTTSSWARSASVATNIQPSLDTSPQQSVRFIPYLLSAADTPQQIRYTSSLQYNQLLNQVYVTASQAVTASYTTGSIFTGTNVARSASYAVSASHLIGGGAPYGVYTATFQAAAVGEPVVNVLQDTIGISSTWGADAFGSFVFGTTGTGYTSLPFNKTYWSVSVMGDDSTTPRLGYLQFNNGVSSCEITLFCTDVLGNPDPRVGGGTTLWGNIEIRRYP